MVGEGPTLHVGAAKGRIAGWLFAASLCAPLAACSLLLDTSKSQCTVDADCDARGGSFVGAQCVSSFCVPRANADGGVEAGAVDGGSDGGVDGGVDPILGCVGTAHRPVPTTTTVSYDLFLHDFLVQTTPVTSVTARLCPNPGDPLCTGGTQPLSPGADGHVKFTVDVSQGAFKGYVAVDPIIPDGGGGPEPYLATRITYSSVPIAADLKDDWLMATSSTLTTFTNLYKLPPLDPTLGFAIVVVNDCQSKSLVGATAIMDLLGSTTRSFYFLNGSPSTTASVTDDSGYVGFLNSPTGARTFTASVGSKRYGSLTTYVYPNTMSVGPLGPDLLP